MEVLQKELVQVQTLMDSMTREREEESERLKNHYEQLKANYTTSEVREAKRLKVKRSSADSHFTLTLAHKKITCYKHIQMHTDSQSLHYYLEDYKVDVKYSVVVLIYPLSISSVVCIGRTLP